jgi:hypothetical protein
MKTKLFAALVAVGTLQIPAEPANAESNRVTFPQDIERLVHYVTVRRGQTTEHISTTPEAIEAVKNGQPVPNGTKFVLTQYESDKLYRYFVMEKGEGWGADYGNRTGNWQFQWFWPDKSVNMDENTTRCMGCHVSQRSRDFLYTARRIPDYNGQPVE